MKQTIAILIIVAAGIVSIAIFWDRSSEPVYDLESFASCLREKGAVMYGAEWCPHCQNEKRAFGDSFRLVPYVECPDEPQKCLDLGIDGYPTWIFSANSASKQAERRFIGEQGVEKLSKESGCPLRQSSGETNSALVL